MQKSQKHYHGWILRINGTDAWFEPIEGAYSTDIKCRRLTTKMAGGDASKIIVLTCKDEEACPSRLKEAALAI